MNHWSHNGWKSAARKGTLGTWALCGALGLVACDDGELPPPPNSGPNSALNETNISSASGGATNDMRGTGGANAQLTRSGGTNSVSPVTGGAASSNAASGGTTAITPANGGTATVTPVTGGTSAAVSPTGGTSTVVPTTGGVGSVGSNTGGTATVTPATGGVTVIPAATGGVAADPPATGGVTVIPAATGGVTVIPAATGGVAADPPATGGVPSQPPATGGTVSEPPATGGAGSEPAQTGGAASGGSATSTGGTPGEVDASAPDDAGTPPDGDASAPPASICSYADQSAIAYDHTYGIATEYAYELSMSCDLAGYIDPLIAADPENLSEVGVFVGSLTDWLRERILICADSTGAAPEAFYLLPPSESAQLSQGDFDAALLLFARVLDAHDSLPDALSSEQKATIAERFEAYADSAVIQHTSSVTKPSTLPDCTPGGG